jgi:hypothetical protein
MAIEMIEKSELANFREGRLGWKQFADEGYKNYTGGEDFFNLFGSRKEKKSAIRSGVASKYAKLPTDCDNIQTSIDIISNDLATLLKQKQKLQQREAIDETNIILGQFKKLQISQKCQEVRAQKEAEQQRAGTLDTLTKLSDISVGKAQAELAGIAPSGQEDFFGKNKNLLIYGGVGLAALIGIALILRR